MMKKILYILLSVLFVNSIIGQSIRFSYIVGNPDPANNQSKLTVFAQKIGGGVENVSAFNYGFYYKMSEATVQGQAAGFTSNNMSAAQLALCVVTTPAVSLGWAPEITGSVIATSSPAGLPAGYDRLFTGAIADGNLVGTDVGATPTAIIALLLDNTVGGAPINTDSAYMAGTDTNMGYKYSNTNFEEFDVIIVGDRLKTLPIELISFDARKFNERHASITWSTASEINSSHFLVQRSFDKKTWTNAGLVNAAGLSSIIVNYSFVDENVYNGRDAQLKVYYRLQMFDLDGRNKLSSIETVKFGNDAIAGGQSTFDVYPNPATEGVQVEWDNDNVDQPTSFELYDIEGKLILTQSVSENTNQEYVDFRSVSIQPGVYLLRIMNGTEPIEHKQIVVGQNR